MQIVGDAIENDLPRLLELLEAVLRERGIDPDLVPE